LNAQVEVIGNPKDTTAPSDVASRHKMASAVAAATIGPLKLTREELKQYDGSAGMYKLHLLHEEFESVTLECRRLIATAPDSGPIIVAISGKLYDVQSRRDLYGKGGGYAAFSGKDASYVSYP